MVREESAGKGLTNESCNKKLIDAIIFDKTMKYYQAFISAENKEQASKILDALLEKKLIIGGPILEGPAKFLWKGEIARMNYCYILTYTIEKFKEQIIVECKKASMEEVPMVSFIPFEGNNELLDFISLTLG